MSGVRTIAVLGSGTMGAGIAQAAAQAGFEVRLHDVSDDLVSRGRARIEAFLQKGVAKGKVEPSERDAALARIHPTRDLAEAAGECDLIIEAIPEDVELKKALFAQLAAQCGDATVFASNTSSLGITDLAAATDRPDRFLGMHFFNPVPIMKLLELVIGERTSPETTALAREVGGAMGKDVIEVKDSPGFATSRLGIVLGMEAIRMVEEGVASAEDIDKAMTLGYGHPMGPLRLTDLVGLDVRLAIAEHLHRTLGSETFRPPELLRRMVAEGRLGKKSGRGFYDWS